MIDSTFSVPSGFIFSLVILFPLIILHFFIVHHFPLVANQPDLIFHIIYGIHPLYLFNMCESVMTN